MTDVMDDTHRIKRGILDLIHTYGCEQVPEEAFGALAHDVFIYQYMCGLLYRYYYAVKRVTPAALRDWWEIPPVPVDGFKHLDFSTILTEQCEAIFMTSGTTHGGKMRGHNFYPDLEVWDESMTVPFRHFIMPDRERTRIAVISSAWDMNQNSSLSRYLTKAVKRCGNEGGGAFFDEHGLKFDGVIVFLNHAVSNSEPVMLVGVSLPCLYLFDYPHEHDLTFVPAPNNRLFDTGGFKGTKCDITEDRVPDELEQTLGMSRHHCVNIYGMTELSLQVYDQNTLPRYTDGASNHLKANPVWVHTIFLNLETLTLIKDDETDVTVHYDLTSWSSYIGILTEDLGHRAPDGFLLQDRAKGAEARECLIAVNKVISANR